MGKIVCPACGHLEHEILFPSYTGNAVTSDLMVLEKATIDNRCCRGCGLIFNAQGTRNITEEFYEKSYSLMMQDEKAGLQTFAGIQPISQAERSYQILREMILLAKKGTVLEIGAGKGEFLSYFHKDLTDWRITAIEPGRAFDILARRLSDAVIHRCDYTSFSLKEETYDLIVALGVLEHVLNPLGMMKWAWSGLKDGGLFFIRVPNFANNPSDIFCVDHLSKLTVATLGNLASVSGFQVQEIKETGVPLFMSMKKVDTRRDNLRNEFEANFAIAKYNADYCCKLMNAIAKARETSSIRHEKFGIFGTTVSGLFAPFFIGFTPGEISAYIDEDKAKWGSTGHERPVGGLDLIEAMRIRHIAIVISPVYVDKVVSKLKDYLVEIYVP